MVPLYIRYMGAEAYGLVGFFAMLQVWFNLLDMGLTPTMARESARFHGGASTALEYRRLARALEGVFCAVAVLGGCLLYALAEPMATEWLKASQLPTQEITQALQLIALIVALRWMSGLYRGVITGAERLVWLSGFNSLVATGRFVLVLPVLMFVSAAPKAFFIFQLGVAVFELLGLTLMAYRLLPAIPKGQRIHWEWAPLKPVLKFSLSIAFTSSVWVLITQTDKLILSKILSLENYGYFTVAVLLASGISAICTPITNALIPRMTRLNAENLHGEVRDLYRKYTRFIVLVSAPISLLMINFPNEILFAWSGNRKIVENSSLTLSLYSAGYWILVVAAFPSYLQYAVGRLKFHVIGNILFLIVNVPLLIYLTTSHGGNGAAFAWFITNLTYLLFWTPVVHFNLLKGVHLQWLAYDIFTTALPVGLVALLARSMIVLSDERIYLIQQLAVLAAGLCICSYTLDRLTRKSA